eukprot:Sspe_Gene.33187::Locus_16228_Transcript_1_1_Confidence_1.000_Length_3154::g.33187::m.33187
MVLKLSSSRIMSLDFLATSVPDPIPIPISAFFSAKASFTPSPVMAHTNPWACRRSVMIFLCSGTARAKSFALRMASSCSFGDMSSNSWPVKALPFVLSSGSNTPISRADRLRGILVVPSDDDDTDVGRLTGLDPRLHLLPRRVEDPHEAQEGQSGLNLDKLRRVGEVDGREGLCLLRREPQASKGLRPAGKQVVLVEDGCLRLRVKGLDLPIIGLVVGAPLDEEVGSPLDHQEVLPR